LFLCVVGAITGNRTGAAADGEEEKRDFRSASGGDEAGRAMAWTAEPNAVDPRPGHQHSLFTALI